MRSLKIAVLMLLLYTNAQAQKAKDNNEYAAIDGKALLIPPSQTGSTKDIANYIKANFTTEDEKVRAAFIWTATNLHYDVENRYAIDLNEKDETKIAKALTTRKGICVHYAATFNDICLKCGIRSFVISGYTKRGDAVAGMSHAWCGAVVGGQWYLFDPTWGSGYVENERFVSKINNSYFKAVPDSFIRTHMPFDPMWEFLYYPITNQSFYEGRTSDKSAPYFSFPDSVQAYEHMEEIAQFSTTARRVEQNGTRNDLIFNYLFYAKQNATTEAYNSALADFNISVNSYNDFVQYHNRQFKPVRKDEDIQKMADTASNSLASAQHKLALIQGADRNTTSLMTTLKKQMDDLAKAVDEEQQFVKKYLSKNKLARTLMFHTWMGMPISN